MTPYFIFFTLELLLILLCAAVKAPQQRRLVVVVVVIVLMSLFSGLRDLVGFDTGSYHTLFNSIDSERFSIEDWLLFEPLFSLVMWIVKFLFNDPNIFMLCISLIQGWIIYLICQHQSRPWIFLVVYLCGFYLQNQFNIVRVGISALLLVYAYVLNREGRNNTAILVSAFLFHYSSIIVGIFMIRGKRSFNTIIFIGVVTLVTFFVGGGDRAMEKFTFYFLESNFYSTGNIIFGPYFVGTSALMILTHFIIGRREGWLLHLFFCTLLTLKILQMPFPVLWRAYDLFYFIWLAILAYSVNLHYTNSKIIAILTLSAVNFWFVTIHTLIYESETLADRVNQSGEVGLFNNQSPLVPYKTFILNGLSPQI